MYMKKQDAVNGVMMNAMIEIQYKIYLFFKFYTLYKKIGLFFIIFHVINIKKKPRTLSNKLFKV